MHLNTLSPAPGSKCVGKRLGRGIGSGFGKTGGRGHKGQKSRSGGSVPSRFEGGQTPLYRRLPKFGFNSRKAKNVAEVRLSSLEKLKSDIANLETLKLAKIIGNYITSSKIILHGVINRPITVTGLKVTKGARAAINAVGGKVEG